MILLLNLVNQTTIFIAKCVAKMYQLVIKEYLMLTGGLNHFVGIAHFCS